jgi:phosphonoacetate hydrolase
MIMMDGFGQAYLDASDMPVLKSIMAKGLYKIAKDMMPSVTNCNNAAICTGTFPEANGIVGNSFYNYKTNEEELMEDSSLVMAPTIFTRAATLAISPEIATEEWTNAIGLPPDKYSSEVNYWTFNAAIHTMKTRPDIGLYYIHTTDYSMHMWEPGDARSKQHLHTIDSLLGVVIKTLPNAAIFITADHGMNHKSKVWDVTKALANRGLPIKLSLSASKDLYPKHHLGFGGCVYVYLNKAGDTAKAKKILLSLRGVESVYTRREAVNKFHEMASRIGDLVVLGDKNTVLGEAATETEPLAATYRSHGSVYEQDVPLIIYNIPHPAAAYFKYNKDLLRWLY